MRPPAPAPLITYTKYLRRASSRSPRANSSRPLGIAVPLRPLSVIRALHRLGSLGRRAGGSASCGARGAVARRRRAVCRRPSTVPRRARTQRSNQPERQRQPHRQQLYFSSSTVTVRVSGVINIIYHRLTCVLTER